jgi:triosephosphate isomerase
MLADVGVTYGIVGHSERRQYYGETDAVVAQKCLRLQEQGLNPLFVWVKVLPNAKQGRLKGCSHVNLKP